MTERFDDFDLLEDKDVNKINPPKCPTCDHSLKGLFDYPKISIVGYERKSLPEEVKFPIQAQMIGPFVNPDSDAKINKKIPRQVYNLFADQKPQTEELHIGNWTQKNEYVEYKGWKWIRHDRSNPEWTTYDLWKEDAKKILLFHINRFQIKLEQLVGKEVPIALLNPPGFPRQISYWLKFVDNKEDVNDNIRESTLEIQSIGMMLGIAGHTIDSLGPVGILKYQGKLNN